MNASHNAGAETGSPPRRLNTRDAAVATLIFLALLALALMAWKLAPLVLLVFGGALVAIFFRSLAEWTARWTNLSYGWSLLISATPAR